MTGIFGTSSLVLPVLSLWRREVIRFARQRSRWVGALGTPVVFWLLLGSGLRDSFRVGESATSPNYLEYAFPGTMILIVLFTAIFATISVIDDRQAGFLQAVLAAPVDRSAIVLGKILGSSTLATIQAMLFMLIAPLTGVPFTFASVLAALGVLIAVSLGLSALGFVFAWQIDSTQGFHAVMNLILMPMWLLSGALFPANGASTWVGWAMSVNPITYGVAALRHVLYLGSSGPADSLPPLGLSLLVISAFTVVMTVFAIRVVGRTK